MRGADKQGLFKTTEPIWNPTEGVIGYDIKRDRTKKIMLLSMTKNIIKMADTYLSDDEKRKVVKIPLPLAKYIVRDADLNTLEVEEDRRLLDKKEQLKYLGMVGSLLWVHNVRPVITFPILYLTWSNKNPRVHHFKLAKRVIAYLYHSLDIPLVIGGAERMQIVAFTDASHATGPNLRTIIAHGVRLNPLSGFIYAKAKATDMVTLSSFEGELNGTFEGNKTSRRIFNIMIDLDIDFDHVRIIIGDNEKEIEFIKGDAEGSAIKHAALRLWSLREEYATGGMKLLWNPGEDLPVNPFTKATTDPEFTNFVIDVQGLQLLGIEKIPVELKSKAAINFKNKTEV